MEAILACCVRRASIVRKRKHSRASAVQIWTESVKAILIGVVVTIGCAIAWYRSETFQGCTLDIEVVRRQKDKVGAGGQEIKEVVAILLVICSAMAPPFWPGTDLPWDLHQHPWHAFTGIVVTISVGVVEDKVTHADRI